MFVRWMAGVTTVLMLAGCSAPGPNEFERYRDQMTLSGPRTVGTYFDTSATAYFVGQADADLAPVTSGPQLVAKKDTKPMRNGVPQTVALGTGYSGDTGNCNLRVIADTINAAFRQRQKERQAVARLAEQQPAEARCHRDIERKLSWEHAIAKARRDAVKEHRRATFNTALEQWRDATEMRAFCDALEQAAGAGQPASGGELAAWLNSARARADRIDPRFGTPTLTTIDFTIEPSPEDLHPHLNGWSPTALRRNRGRSFSLSISSAPWRCRTRPEGQWGHAPGPNALRTLP